MKSKTSAVRSMLGWLLLTACIVLAVCAAWSGYAPARRTSYAASGRRIAVEDIPAQAGTIPVNTADAAALDELPGIGPVLAQAIVEERLRNGPFFYPEDLMHVKGIGEKKLEDMRDLLDLTEDLP